MHFYETDVRNCPFFGDKSNCIIITAGSEMKTPKKHKKSILNVNENCKCLYISFRIIDKL